MKKIKLFLEFVVGSKKSLFTEFTYDDIAKKLGCSIDEVEEFENWLDETIQPGKMFAGSLDETPHDDADQEREMIDEIKSWEDYDYMWKRYQNSLTSQSSHSHDEEGL